MTRPAPTDTIAAVATAPGVGGVGIVRVSGPRTSEIALALLGKLPAPRRAQFTSFRDAGGQAIDQGLALYFVAPHSFTGEAVLELHGHGGPVVMDLLLKRALELGARLARPGEFSERAFLNGKLDLAQAEAVADLIESGTEAAARAALNSLQGVFSKRIRELDEALVLLRTHIEAALDFPEEEIDFLADGALAEQSDTLHEKIIALLADTRQGQLLHDGMTVVLAGRPNAGKSSLLNLLAQHEAAIVSPVPGTTRDIVRERIQVDGLPLHVLDTAGLRASADAIESEGVRRAQAAMERADRVLLLVDDSQQHEADVRRLLSELPAESKTTLVLNKIDISGRAPGRSIPGQYNIPEIAISARDGAGLDALRMHLKESMGYAGGGRGAFSARRRHLEAIEAARLHVLAAGSQLAVRRGELAAEELQQAHKRLGEITGEFTNDDLLGKIFSTFCIGK